MKCELVKPRVLIIGIEHNRYNLNLLSCQRTINVEHHQIIGFHLI